MFSIMKMYMLFIGSNIIIVASMSNFHSDKHTNQTSTTENGLHFKWNSQRIDSAERIRRLIPYMTFYIPTSSRDYLPTSPYRPINKPMNPYIYHESATIPTNYNAQHLYLPSAGAAIQRKPTYVDDKIKNKLKQSQPITKNTYVTPLVDVVVPQQSYQLNSDVYNNEAGTQLIRPAAYSNENGENLTPFLPSNQVPGPFRPIISPKNYTHDFPNTLNRPNRIKYSNKSPVLKESIPLAVTNTHQLRPESHIQAYYVASSTSSTEQPITNNGIDDNSVQQVYLIKPILKSEINDHKSVIKMNYPQRAQQRYKQFAKNIQTTKATKINYDIDPDDGYGGRVLLPYESYYTKDYKSVPHIQSTVHSSYLQKPTAKPVNNEYNYKPEPTINAFEPVSYESYKNTHQHLTETTPIGLQTNQNQSTIEIKPIAYGNLISTTSSPKPLHDILYNMNKTSLQLLLTKLKENNYLPKTFTMNKLDNSLRTLTKVLSDLKKTQKPIQNDQHSPLYPVRYPPKHQPIKDTFENLQPIYPLQSNEAPGPQSGEPGVDFPVFSVIPKTSFNCSEQRYKGFFGDPDTSCQVWHYCDLNGGQASFLCPNGTIFNQVLLTCDWWFNVKCSSTAQLYVLNERLYKYILPLNPKFPEDYSGPLVDKYLAIKYQEMEEKMQHERTRNRVNNNEDIETDIDTTSTEDITLMGETDSMQTTTTENSIIITSDTEPTTPDYRNYYQTTTFIPPLLPPLPPPPKFHVESERAEVIEIRSDGSSGHLVRGG
ncbi:uncharacterized protein LOC116352314 [Contarinia nasturtii]|uniref:uncharacterized protein LOC116352314 n=1 Tax=Contarinia nasturtii TaxID=265458 RepID=UPI0012D3B422|nr:uncharacterized protein LOC116352314 [Contarinia nasturtii]